MALRGLRDVEEEDDRTVTEERSGALLLGPQTDDSLSLRGRRDSRSSSQERIITLCLSVLTNANKIGFEALSFLAFLSLFCLSVVSICLLVYFPVSDSMALRGLRDVEEEDDRTVTEERSGALLLGPQTDDSLSLRGRRDSRSSSQERYVELSLFLEAEN
ncbi:hypothetical protein F2Q69_00041305 [Brassica cretica]|uniref:Transmembrane protein n=1 Tax=Brassica cretica TaxID=69181 RepID=A0A8S9N7B1_BRACR|nr:hypothetical protein F2Q69_00041305 [Brassica cretica]